MKITKRNSLKKIAFTGACLLLIPQISLAAQYVSVIKDDVNVRTEPNTTSPVYMELFQGYPLEVLQKKGDWLKIQDYEQDSGWIYAPLVSSHETVIVSAKNNANMRKGPSTKDAIVANIERGVVLERIERKGDWTHVRHSSGTEGWVINSLLWP